MKKSLMLGALVCAAPFFPAKSAQATEMAECNDKQLLAYVPSSESIPDHRRYSLPVIDYPYGTKKDDWGFSLTLRVDESGRVACYSAKDDYGRGETLEVKRRAAIELLATWKYEPFMLGGKPVAAIVSEKIYEQELPQKHIQLPKVPLNDVHISLERTACFGACPTYKVDVYGDGRVVYNGIGFVDVEGEHRYRVLPEDVSKLIDSLRIEDIWSFRDSYRAPITDNPIYILTMDIGSQTHHLEDYVGAMAGMPSVVTDFELEVDRIAQSDTWIQLQQPAVERLKAEGFRFESEEGGRILQRAVSNQGGHDEGAMLSLIKLGAPTQGIEHPQARFSAPPASLMEATLQNHRASLVDPLIKKGALSTDGKPDQEKIDAAFRAAIRGGRLAVVEKIWDVRGIRMHPSLTFDDISDDNRHVKKKSPVTMMLSPYAYRDSDWEGLEITKWLAAKGCDLKGPGADGTTLLHLAAKANDARFVRYLLDQGLDPSAPGKYGLPALGSTQNEDVALMLLVAGTDPSRLNGYGGKFRDYAVSNHWSRVVAWLDAHEAR